MSRSRLAIVLSLLVVPSCAQGRLWRISPITGSNPSDPERVTLWPLMYVDSTSAALLWPLMDFDDHGFAVRPLVAKDDEQLDVLFPLSHFDLDKGDGWALNVYSFGESAGFFPLAHFGPGLSYAGLAYWKHDDAGALASWGLLPIGHFNVATGDGYFLTAYKSGEGYGVLPLFHHGPGANYIGPVWWNASEPEGQEDYGLFPLLYHCGGSEGATTTLLPLWWYRERGERRDLITPLGGAGWDEEGTRFVNVLGPVWYRSVEDDASTTALLWPLFQRNATAAESDTWLAAGLAHVGTTAAGSSWRFLPLASSSTDEAADGVLDNLTLFRREVRGDVSQTRLFPLWESDRGPERESDELLFSLVRRMETPLGSSWRAWPLASKCDAKVDDAPGLHDVIDDFTLFGVDRAPERLHVHAGTPLLFSLDRHGEQKESWSVHVLALFAAGHEERPPASDAATTVERDHAGFLFDWFKVESRVVRTPDGATHRERHLRLPLLHEYETTPDGTEWDALCYALHSKTTPTEQQFNVLGYAWRSTTTATEVHRDVFPAITYDKTPDSTRWSFLWRLLRYERHGEKVGGHVLFVPWGDGSL